MGRPPHQDNAPPPAFTPLPSPPPIPEAPEANPGALATESFRPPSPLAQLRGRANREGRRERGSGGGAERRRSHFGGRETIGRKRRGTGLWPQVTPAPPARGPAAPGLWGGCRCC